MMSIQILIHLSHVYNFMKKILCVFSNTFSGEKKNEILRVLKNYIEKKAFAFEIELFYSDMPKEKLKNYSYFIVCNPPKEILKNLSSAEFILSLNMGVEDIVPHLPASIKNISRMVHKISVERICSYVLYCALDFFLLMDRYRKSQANLFWERSKPFERQNQRIGIMGLGEIGKCIAEKLYRKGYDVIGYATTPKSLSFPVYDKTQLNIFLSQTNLLINALPLTKETYEILNKNTLNFLPEESAIVNIARGAHICEADLLSVLATSKLAKAYLDVFRNEPLPKDHLFWRHPKIFLTPHISGVFDVMDVLEGALDTCFLFYKDKIVLHPVQMEKGY